MIKDAKRNLYPDSLQKAASTQKALFETFGQLIGPINNTHLPDNFPENQLHKLFSDYLTEKIHKIRTELNQEHLNLSPTAALVPELNQPPTPDRELAQFKPTTVKELGRIAKTCVLDSMPLVVLHEAMDTILSHSFSPH